MKHPLQLLTAVLLALLCHTASADPFTPKHIPSDSVPIYVLQIDTGDGLEEFVAVALIGYCGGDPVNKIDPMGTTVMVAGNPVGENSIAFAHGWQQQVFNAMVRSSNSYTFFSAANLRQVLGDSGNRQWLARDAGMAAQSTKEPLVYFDASVVGNSISDQADEMGEGVNVIADGDFMMAREEVVKTMADQYAQRIETHKYSNGGDLNAAIDSATGWKMILADFTGGTSLDEGLNEIDFNDGAHLEEEEANVRILQGVGGLAGTAAGGSGTTLRVGSALMRTQAAQKLILSASLRYGSMNIAPSASKPGTALVGKLPIKFPYYTPMNLDGGVQISGNGLRELQEVTNQVAGRLAANPALARTVLRPAEYAAGQRSVGIARMQYGNAVERLAANSVARDRLLDQLFRHVGGPSRPDFVGRGPYSGLNYDITTPGGVAGKARRPYGPGLLIPTYRRLSTFRVLP